MKKITLLSTAIIIILAAVSCSRDSYKETLAPDSARTTINARLLSTKTALGEKDGVSYPNYWKTGDQISVNGIVSEALDAEADGKPSADFTFASALSTPYCAAYPAAAVSDYSAGSATLTIPAAQTYVAGSYDPAAFIMGGTSTNPESVSLTPFVSIFHLTLSGSASISSVKLTGAPEAAMSGSFTTDFSTFTPASVSNVVEMVAASPVALPAEFFICIPPSVSGSFTVEVFDSEGGSMNKTATIKSALSAGQMYSASTTYSGGFNPVITAEGVTSSTAVICWGNSPEAAYTIGVYSDAGCSSLVDSYEVPAGDACWGGKSPRFCISGLEPGTTYYVKVTNVAHSADSNILPVTTEDFSIVEVSDDPAEVDEVILAEDFGELRWDCDIIGGGAGWFPTAAAQAASFATVEVDSYRAVETASEKQLSPQTGPLAGSRLMHWAQGANKNIYIHPGYLKLVGSSKVTHIVTPALNSIPDGKVATLEVEVTASAYYSESSGSFCTTNAVVAVQSGEFGELVTDATNTLDLTGRVAAITLSEESAWNTYKVTLNGVSHGDRLAFGAASGVSGNDARMNISDIKVTIKALNSPGDLVATVKNVSSSTASFTWTHLGEDAAFDVSKPYTAALYSDSSCSSLVVSHEFDADAACWGGKVPCFSFGGLTPSTNYWFVVTDTDSDTVSNAVEITTAAFTPVDATTVSNAAAGDVILAENFGEIAAGPDEFAGAAGFIPTVKDLAAPSGANPEGSYVVSDNTGNRIFGNGWDLGDSRLSHGWGFFGNSSVYLRNAYLRVSTTSGRTHIVTPELSGIPEGKLATIEVTVTATKHESSENDVAVFVEKGLVLNGTTDATSASYKKYTGASLSDGYALGITGVKEWETRTVTISGVDSECQLVIGSLENISGKNRFSISDIVVTAISIAEPMNVQIKDFASLKSFIENANAGTVGEAEVTANVTLSSAEADELAALLPISKPYSGSFDGGNFTIEGLTAPLFGEFAGSAQNITLNSAIVAEYAQSGIFACSLADGASLTNVKTQGSISIESASEIAESIYVGGVAGIANGATLTSCSNEASVFNTADSGIGIFIGGLLGQAENCTFVASSNEGAVANSGFATDSKLRTDVCIGGLVGCLKGDNSLAGTASEYNSNNGPVSDNSTTTYMGVGGIVGLINGDGNDLTFVKNLANGDITYGENTRYSSYIGGVAGCAQTGFTMDDASNAGDINITNLTVSSSVWIGGILGGFHKDAQNTECTFNRLSNSGKINCPNKTNNGGNMMASSSTVTAFSYIGGISGNGDSYSKYFLNCSNSGLIVVFNQLKTRLGGILGYTDKNPEGAVNTGAINYCRYNTQSNGGNGQIGGIVGYMNVATPANLTNDATVRSTGSSPNCFTGGLIGQVGDNTVGFLNCKVGTTTGDNSGRHTISGAGENAFGSTAAGVFCSDGTANAWDFTGCKIKTGTVCQNLEVTAENLSDAIIGRNHASSITNPPSIEDF